MARLLHICTSDDFLHFIEPTLLRLAALGHDVHFATGAGPRSSSLAQRPGLTGHVRHLSRSISPLRDALSIRQTSRLIRHLKPDLVHTHNPKGGLVGMTAAWLGRATLSHKQSSSGSPGPRRVHTVHGLPYVTATGARHQLLRQAERATSKMAERVICVSESVKARMIADGIVSAEKAIILGAGSAAGIDLHAFDAESWREPGQALRDGLGISAEAPVVLFLGRLHREKGLAELGQAWPIIRAKIPGAHLLLAGQLDPTDLPDLHQLQNDDHAHFLGFLDDPRPALAAASLLVLPTHREGLPNVVLEAGAMALPVVASDVLGCIDVIQHKETGLLVKPYASDALAQAVLCLLTTPNLATRLGEAARREIHARFGAERLFEELIALYRELGIESR